MMYLVLDRLEGGSVASLCKQEGHVEESYAAYIMSQVVYAISYCHNLGIAVSFSSPLPPPPRYNNVMEHVIKGRSIYSRGDSCIELLRITEYLLMYAPFVP